MNPQDSFHPILIWSQIASEQPIPFPRACQTCSPQKPKPKNLQLRAPNLWPTTGNDKIPIGRGCVQSHEASERPVNKKSPWLGKLFFCPAWIGPSTTGWEPRVNSEKFTSLWLLELWPSFTSLEHLRSWIMGCSPAFGSCRTHYARDSTPCYCDNDAFSLAGVQSFAATLQFVETIGNMK